MRHNLWFPFLLLAAGCSSEGVTSAPAETSNASPSDDTAPGGPEESSPKEGGGGTEANKGPLCEQLCAKAASAKCAKQSTCISDCEALSASTPAECKAERDATLDCAVEAATSFQCAADGAPKAVGCDDQAMKLAACLSPPPAVDPLCKLVVYDLKQSGYSTKATAMEVSFVPKMKVGGTTPRASPGAKPARWFTFTVDTPRNVDVSIDTGDVVASFFFEAETESQFGVGSLKTVKYNEPLRVGRYYVKVADLYIDGLGQGHFFNVSMSWSTKPAVCVGDAGP
jgi:hypothetical protein